MIIPRIPPLRNIPDKYDEIAGKQSNEEVPEGVGKMKWALNLAGHRVETATAKGVVKSGLHVYSSMFFDLIPIVMAWGTIVLILVEYTPIFDIIATPFGWYMDLLGIEGAKEIAPTALVGFADMYIPPLMLADFPIERTIIAIPLVTVLTNLLVTF